MNYKAYCKQRLDDLKKFKSLTPGELNLHIKFIQGSLENVSIIEKIKEVLESHLGRVINNAEVDLWLSLIGIKPEMVKELGIVDEVTKLSRIGQRIMAENS